MADTKVCPKCSVEKEIATDFKPQKSGRRAGKAHSYCRQCRRAGTRDWEARNPDRKKAYQTAYQNKYRKIRPKADSTAFPSRCAEWERVRTLKKYGKDLTWYNEAARLQDGKCAICHRPETRLHPTTKKVCSLSIDHNHNTGQVRGLLCSKCNINLHSVETVPNWAENATLYLEQFRPQTA